MLESIILTRHNKNDVTTPLDIGTLIECLLFYEKTTVIADSQILNQLFSYFGATYFRRLLNEGYLNLIYMDSLLGIMNRANNADLYIPLSMTVQGRTLQEELLQMCIGIPRGMSLRKFASELEEYILTRQHDSELLESINKIILNQQYTTTSAQTIINYHAPSISTRDLVFKPYQTEAGIKIETTLDFQHPDFREKNITAASILADIAGVEAELYFAAVNHSDISCSDLSSQLATNRLDYLFQQSKKNTAQLNEFKKSIFLNADAIREAANARRINHYDLFKVLEKSRILKEKFCKYPPDANLLQSFYDELDSKSFFGSLPGKVIQLAVFTSLGVYAGGLVSPDPLSQTLAGLVTGGIEVFLFDKLILKRTPNQFINRDLKKLISKEP